jgi:Zn-dependent M28 family amino/carboxypeptidase
MSALQQIKKITKEISIYRPIGSKNLKHVKQYIMEYAKNIGLHVEEQKFKKKIRGHVYSFSNIIVTNPRSSPPYLMLLAHSDAPMIPGTEAALDSATSIAIILELIRNIIRYDPTYPIMALFVDGEEAIGGEWAKDNTLVGSKYFVEHYDIQHINKVFVFDLLGGDFKNKIGAFKNNPQSTPEITLLYDINKRFSNQLFIHPEHSFIERIIEDDHIPFMEKGIHYIHIIPHIFPSSHHTIRNLYSNINWKYIDIFYNVFFEFLKKTV